MYIFIHLYRGGWGYIDQFCNLQKHIQTAMLPKRFLESDKKVSKWYLKKNGMAIIVQDLIIKF